MAARKNLGLIILIFVSGVYALRSVSTLIPLIEDTFSPKILIVSFILGCLLLIFPQRHQKVNPGGKAVLITGCDSGFGNNLARKLDADGFQVFAGCLFADREGARGLDETTSDRLKIVQLDVTDDWQVRCAVKEVRQNLEEGSALWAVVNNAGIATFQEIEWCSVFQFQQIMDVNVIGVVRVTKAFLPLLRDGTGRVINVASLAGRFTVPAFAAYSMSKKACIAFSDGLRQEMAKFGVKVITIEPGLYKTPIAETDHLIDANRKSWAETPTEVKEVYGEEYFDAFCKTITKQMKRARANVAEVVAQMEEAVTVEEPKLRYVPYWMSHVRATILTYLPESLRDKFFQSLYKIDAHPQFHRSNSTGKPQFNRSDSSTKHPTISE